MYGKEFVTISKHCPLAKRAIYMKQEFHVAQRHATTIQLFLIVSRDMKFVFHVNTPILYIRTLNRRQPETEIRVCASGTVTACKMRHF
jgi:hypothetical protein